MKKKRNAFTLIELLAVIVVLAIIALIATPIVMNTIKKSKKGAAERSADSFVKQVETTVATERLNGNIIEDGEYEITSDGNLCKDKSASCSDESKIKVEMNGTKPTSGKVKITNGQIQSETMMIMGNYYVIYKNGKYIVSEIKKYQNGEEVYFNVTTGEKCSSSDYTETQSNTGTKSGCMKFYAFNDDGEDIVKLILDHNTTAIIGWNLGGSNVNGPKEVLEQLKNDTDTWQGTITPANYTMDQTGQDSNAKYTIDYSSYKARLITAQEIAQITGNTSWDEKVAGNTSGYYLDSKTTTASPKCQEGNTSGCKYGWLYDRTNTNCTTYGCLNNADSSMAGLGYWTSSSHAVGSVYAWIVNFRSNMNNRGILDSGNYGVRPVIEVLRFKIS